MKNVILLSALIALISLLVTPVCMAGETGLPLPRFVSLRSSEVNMRTGPGTRYPIDWVYTKRGLPVEIVNEYDTWRKIRDVTGDEGWVHQSMLSGTRTALVTEKIRPLYAEPNIDSNVLARMEPGVMVMLEECTGDWCEINIDKFDGWMTKSALWGAYPHEKF